MFERLQTLCLFGALLILAATEACSLMLWHAPSSEILWWLTLDVFGSLRRTVDGLLADLTLKGLLAGGLVLCASAAALARRWPLGLAILSNAGFVAVLAAVLAKGLAGGQSLADVLRAGSAAFLLVATTGLAMVASHVGYWRRIARGRGTLSGA